MKIFAEWLQAAEKSEPNDPTAMSLATVDHDGMPNCRMVLMRRFDDRGIVTNPGELTLLAREGESGRTSFILE